LAAISRTGASTPEVLKTTLAASSNASMLRCASTRTRRPSFVLTTPHLAGTQLEERSGSSLRQRAGYQSWSPARTTISLTATRRSRVTT
jgi:hypothetical protein